MFRQTQLFHVSSQAAKLYISMYVTNFDNCRISLKSPLIFKSYSTVSIKLWAVPLHQWQLEETTTFCW